MFGRAQGINFGGIPKLLAPEISLGGNFSYDINGQFYSTTTIYGYIKNKSCQISYETLLAIMNSSLCWWFLKNTGTVLANGYFRYKPTYLKPFPLPIISQKKDKEIKDLVKKLQQEDDIMVRKHFENDINQKIYDLYNLTTKDINIVLS
ncbi:TaqI-like C-terminal specificity domain-containing protein [Bacteroides fragilis]|uniref:TaqI-like C-terminal specificity domain-containing protein n=1 Tax=Bacteroides fragilis TaxID=817 RepID=UPI0004507FA2|nr:TaqI-like C-terminal specificity domain-containing protein [Bacteroides fragilis]EXZ51204.1 taqI-like C-terminal specificity domain protein [Bacteroides fragilis str. 3397 N2]EYA44474.1 taqI-like C-terminal specificity domain protein [Bacteroides fragilis str. 3397 N3]EYA44636.1 taqI-like C-terminal specificity domain protein [Bacteroides fragilis str. 3397 N3]EYA45934.1 taqI-like C-terminal specificity domain protein [Bacteroides fragilis str. 3397 N3]